METNPDQDDEGSRGPADWLTVRGRLLLILTLLSFAGGFTWYTLRALETLPSGSYPFLFFAIPVLIAAVVFFFAVAFLLERLGIRIYRRRGIGR
jgi:hypothetical protein